MKKIFWIAGGMALCFLFVSAGVARAEDVPAPTDWKQKKEADKQKIAAERQVMKQHDKAAKAEEKQLKDQIKAAKSSGDTQTAQQLKNQLKTTHQANVQERKQDKKDLQTAQRELKLDRVDGRQEAGLAPKTDKGDNPHGRKGGPGAGPDRRHGPGGGKGKQK